MPTSITDENGSHKEATHALMETGHTILHTADDPPL